MTFANDTECGSARRKTIAICAYLLKLTERMQFVSKGDEAPDDKRLRPNNRDRARANTKYFNSLAHITPNNGHAGMHIY